jgi:serine/threonine protein kinase
MISQAVIANEIKREIPNVYRNVATIFGLREYTKAGRIMYSRVGTLYDDLNQDKATVSDLIGYVSTIPRLNFDLDTGAVIRTKRTTRHSFVRKTPIDGGAHGKIYISSDKSKIYKKIHLEGRTEKEVEEKIRAIFVEAFIQTILSSDATYGKNVCELIGLYRSEDFHTTMVTRHQAPKRVLTLYLVMKPLYKNFWEALKYQHETTKTKMTKGALIRILKKIAEILKYFQETYQFSHRDLHAGNIMFPMKAGGNPVEIDWDSPTLIDFGLSCLTYECPIHTPKKHVYSFVPENVIPQNEVPVGKKPYPRIIESPCESYDLLILFTSLIQYAHKNIDDDCINFLKESTEGANGRQLYPDLDSFHEMYDAVSFFHMVYPDIILNEYGPLYDAIQPYTPFKYIEPAKFIEFANAELSKVGGKRTRHRFRSLTRRRGTRRNRRH